MNTPITTRQINEATKDLQEPQRTLVRWVLVNEAVTHNEKHR